ncbi:MAG: tripartite tricarboxylate transporter substrate binding protein, partial [Burkholderiaceae bacterium]
MIATRAVTREKPDGYTLLITIPAVAALKYINKIDGEDPLAHLKPVSLFASGPTGVVVKGGTNINSIEDFKKTCEKPDAKCSWASGEPFTLLVGTALLEDLGLTDVVNVRYPGTSVAVNDIIGGRVTMVVTGLASIVPHHKSGTMKILAVSTDERQAQIPEVPTYAQAGMGAVKFVNNWYGIFAPRDTPDAVVEQISVAMREAGKDPSVVNVLSPLMIKPVGSTPKEFQAVVKQAEQDVARLSKHLQSQ